MIWCQRYLRFHVALEHDGWRYIEDRHHLASRRWKGTHGNLLPPAEYVDYAVITRVFEQTTGHPVTSVGGITHLGTRAAGEFLLSPEAMGEALRQAPPGWETKNMQIVVATKVIGASASPPQLRALHVWSVPGIMPAAGKAVTQTYPRNCRSAIRRNSRTTPALPASSIRFTNSPGSLLTSNNSHRSHDK